MTTTEEYKAMICRWAEKAMVKERELEELTTQHMLEKETSTFFKGMAIEWAYRAIEAQKELLNQRPLPAADGLIEYNGWLYKRTEEKAR